MKPKFVDIIFGPYEPDWGGMPRAEAPGYLVDALGVRSTPNGYRGMPTLATVSSATVMAATQTYCNGAVFNGDSSSTKIFVVVTAGGVIYESRADGTDTWQNVSPSGSIPDPSGDWVRFGNDMVFFCGARTPVKKAVTSSHATVFTLLGGSPPSASEAAARVRQHVVVVSDLTAGYTVRTSAIGDHEDWPTPGTADARSKQAIEEELNPEYGFPVRVLGGEKFGIVMQERALTRMTYVGGSAVYEFDTYERKIGSGYSSVNYCRPVTDGKLWYWYNEHGVFATDGYSIKNLADGRIIESLFTNTISHPNGSSLKVHFSSAYDPRRGLVLFGSTANVGAASRYLLAYDTRSGQLQIMNSTDETGFFGGLNPGSWPNSSHTVYNINYTDGKLQRLDGAAGTIALQTGYIELEPGQRVQVHGAHLLGADLPSTLTLSYKAAETYDACDVSQSGFTSMTAPGRGIKSTARADAPFFSFRVTGTGSESHLYRGIRVYYEVSGPIQ